MKLNIKWQHLGLVEITAEKLNKARNHIITMTAYCVYSTWVKCGDSKENFKFQNLKSNVQNDLHKYMNIFKCFSKKEEWFKQFYTLVENILITL